AQQIRMPKLANLLTRRRLRRSLEEKLRASTSMLKACSDVRQQAKRSHLEGHDYFLNLIQFTTLFRRDFDVISYVMLQPRHREVDRLHMRLWALLLWECFDDYTELLGNPQLSSTDALLLP